MHGRIMLSLLHGLSAMHSGSAERDGTCRVGDMIVSVDEREVLGQPLAALRSLILGVQGSSVRLGFRRREGLVSDGRFSSFAVELMRGSAEFFQSMVAQQSLEEEVETLRVQLRQALSHCAQVVMRGCRDILDDVVTSLSCA